MFRTVTPLSELSKPATPTPVTDLVSAELSLVHDGISPARIAEAGWPSFQTFSQDSGPSSLEVQQAVGPLELHNPIASGPSSPSGLSHLDNGQHIPPSQEAVRQFEAMVDDMVDRVVTCSICSQRGHLSAACGMRAVCTACSYPGHSRQDCNDLARSNGLIWRPISMQQNTIISESAACLGKGAGVIVIDCPVPSPPPTLHLPYPQPK